MVLYKGLTLLIAVITILNNGCMRDAPNKDKKLSCEDNIEFQFDRQQTTQAKDDYNLKVQTNNCDIIILDKEKLDSIRTGKYPVISFCITKVKYQAKGNKILNSGVPKDCDYFFPINDDGTISFFKENIISCIEIKR